MVSPLKPDLIFNQRISTINKSSFPCIDIDEFGNGKKLEESWRGCAELIIRSLTMLHGQPFRRR